MTTRVLTAIVFVSIMIGGMYSGRYVFSVLFTVIAGLCIWEFIGIYLNEKVHHINFYKIAGTLVGLIPVVFTGIHQLGLLPHSNELLYNGIVLSVPLAFLLFIRELFAQNDEPFQNLAAIFIGLIYIGLPFTMLLSVAITPDGYIPNTVFGVLLLTWINDTGAYLIGSQVGKTPLFPRISPNKTWEGSIAGAMSTLLAGLGMSFLFPEQTLTTWLVLALLTIIFASLGDLVESMFKRSIGVKDSGNILPGHGGFLDRFDAFIFVLPYITAYLLLID